MKTVIVSDSHGNSGIIERILAAERNTDCVIHLGDGADDLMGLTAYTGKIPVYQLKGNNDPSFYNFSPKLITYMGNIKFFACHGHLLDVKYGLTKLYYAAKQDECRVAFFGHTHIPFIEESEEITFFNPGCAYMGQYGVFETNHQTFTLEHKNILGQKKI